MTSRSNKKPSIFEKLIKKCSTERLVHMRIRITKLISERKALQP